MAEITIAEFVPATGEESYLTLRPAFMTEERWRWIWRQHKARLIADHVAVMLGRRIFVHKARLDAFLVQYGQGLAEKRAGIADVCTPPLDT